MTLKHSHITLILVAVGAIALVVYFMGKGGVQNAPGQVTAQDVANAAEVNINGQTAENSFVASNLATAAAVIEAHDSNQFGLDTVVANNASQQSLAKIQATNAVDLATIQTNGATRIAQISASAAQSLAQIEGQTAFVQGQQAVQVANANANANIQQTQIQANAANSIAGKQQTSNIFQSILSAIPVIGGLFG